MAQAYTRQSSIADGDTITAALFNNEYNQLLNAFSYSSSSASSTGHRHDGTAGQGGNIHTIGDLDFLNKIVVDSTNNRWGVFVEVSSAAVEQIRIQDGAIVPVTDNDIDLGTSSVEFKDAYFDGTVTTDALVADTADINGGTVDGATVGANSASSGAFTTITASSSITGSSTVQGTTITATTAFVPDASDGAALGTSSLEFSDLYLADGAVVYFGDDQDVSLTHVADTGLLLSSTDQLQFGDSGTYIHQSADGVLDLVSDTEIEINATTIDINGAADVSGNLDVGGNLTVTGNATIAGNLTFGDAASDTVAFSADVASNLLPSADNTYDLGASDSEWKDLYVDGTAYVDAINFNGTAISATAAELNILDGVTSTAAELNILDGVTATTAELNIMDGVTATTAELNIMDGVTATTAELNIMDGVTATATELNALDGITSTVAELNILDGVTASATDINLIDGITNGTVIASKAIITDSNKDISGGRNITISGELDAATLDISGDADIDGTLETDALSINGTAVTSTAAELNILDGVTSTAAELNILDGVTSTAAELNILDGVTATTAELNYSDTGSAVGTVVASKVVTVDANKDVASFRNITLTGELDAGSLDVSGDADIDGTLEADAYTVNGTNLDEYIEDTVGAMLSSNTETGITVTYEDGDSTIDFAVNAAQTGITSLLATDIKIGEDDQTKIDFETADEIHFYAANAEQVYVADGIFGPQTDSDVDLGSTSVRWKDAYVDSITTTGNAAVGGNLTLTGDLTVNGTTSTVNSTTVTIDDPIFTLGGDSAPGSDDNKDRGIEFRWHNGSAAKVGFFGYDDSASAFTFVPDATNSSEVFSGTVGNAIFGDITGTLQTAAQTNITSVGTLSSATVSGDLTVDTSTLKVDSSNNRVGILNASPDVTLDIGSATDSIHVPVGTTAQRPGSPAAGYFRYNSTTGKFEGYTDSWGSIGGGSGTNMDTNIYAGDGSDTTFTLSTAPDDEQNLMVFIDGVFQAHDTYSVSGTTLTFSTAPASGRVITVYHSTTTVGGSNNTINTMTGDGSDTTLTLSVAPVHENNVQVFFDGVYQSKSNYSISGTTLTFSTAPPDDVLVEAITNTNTTSSTANQLLDSDSDTLIQVEESSDEDKIRFDTGGTERMVLDSTSLTVTPKIVSDAGIDIDNFNIDGTTIALSSGDMTLDSAGDITLDADGADIIFADGGTTFLEIDKDGNNARIKNPISDGDIKIQGNDGGSTITAIDIDMSEGGRSTFSGNLTLSQTGASDEPTLKIASENTSLFMRVAGSSGSFPSGGSGNDLEIFSTGAANDFRIGCGTSSSNLIFINGSSYNERMRIDSSGHTITGGTSAVASATVSAYSVGVSNGFGAKVANAGWFNFVGNNTSDVSTFYVKSNGDYHFAGSDVSDKDLKENITDVPDGSLALVKQLKPRTFNFKASEGFEDSSRTGFIAQEVASVMTTNHSVATGTDGQKDMGVNPMGLIAHLTKAIQELEARLKTLEDA